MKHIIIDTSSGQWIRELRKANFMSQIDFGKRIGVPCDRVSQWEVGFRVPSGPWIQTIANAFGVEITLVPKDESQ